MIDLNHHCIEAFIDKINKLIIRHAKRNSKLPHADGVLRFGREEAAHEKQNQGAADLGVIQKKRFILTKLLKKQHSQNPKRQKTLIPPQQPSVSLQQALPHQLQEINRRQSPQDLFLHHKTGNQAQTFPAVQ